jgi:WASH complex subunit strumpellin
MFNLLAEIISIQTNKLKEVPTLLDKEKLKEFAQLDQRYEIARLTSNVALYTEGILQMKSAEIGCVTVDSKQLLEDGIRKELVIQIVAALHNQLQFSGRSNVELMQRLERLGEQIDGFRRSFEYIQDYVNIYGLKIWQEEFSRIISFHVEQECNTFAKKKVFEYESIYQSKNIPIPVYPPLNNNNNTTNQIADMSVNFIGRLAREILRMTDSKTTYYIAKKQAWFDLKTKEEVVNMRLFKRLEYSINSFGMHGLDRLYSFMISKDLQVIMLNLKRNQKTLEEIYKASFETMSPIDSNSSLTLKFYTPIMNKLGKLYASLLPIFLRLGQVQLLRTKICYELNNGAKFDSKHLLQSLSTFNEALMAEVNAHYDDPSSRPYPDEENPLLYELNPYLECVGLSEPLKKIYFMTSKCEFISFFASMLVVSQLGKLPSTKVSVPVFKGSSSTTQSGNVPVMITVNVDSRVSLVIGALTLLKQYHCDFRNQFIAILGQYVRSAIQSGAVQKPADLPVEPAKVLSFLEEFLEFSQLDRRILETYVPRYTMDSTVTI